MIIWFATVACNLFLALLLVYRGHWLRYRVLFAALVFEVFAFSVLFYTYHHFGTSSAAYASLYSWKKIISIAFGLGIIFEGFQWRNRCVRLPQELYLLALLGFFLAKKAEFFGVAHGIHEVLRWGNLVVMLWWIYIFRKETPHERREF